MQRTIVYVDGFNLYHGALRHTPYKWLNVHALARALIDANKLIVKVKYFTARVSPRANDPDQPSCNRESVENFMSFLSVHYRPRRGCGIMGGVMSAPYTYWQDPKDGMWLGYWDEYPDHMTQGHSLDELKRMLLDLRGIILSGDLGDVQRRFVGTMQLA